MAVYKLLPACKDYLWGGRRLIDHYRKKTTLDVLAETWELSCYPDAPSLIANGAYAGKPLSALIEAEGKERVLGTNSLAFDDFPVLVKLINAAKPLSIQVHPDDSYAQAHGEPFGKNEVWYVLHAEEGASLYLGFKKEIPEAEFRARIADQTLTDVLNRVPVKAGDVFFIETGTLHAINAGITLAEIQQNSNATYRVFDYGRKDKDGKERPLHIEQAIAVTKRVPYRPQTDAYPHVAVCKSFVVDRLYLGNRQCAPGNGHGTSAVGSEDCLHPDDMSQTSATVTVDKASFLHLLVTDGAGTLCTEGDTVPFTKGESLFLPAGSGTCAIEGTCELLLTAIPAQTNPLR